MGKALMVNSAAGIGLANGNESPLFGSDSFSSTEAHSQTSCSEAATFSNLAINVISGNSGTLTLRFRDAGADGQQVVSFSGAASSEDAVNTDVLSAGDLFNVSYVDTGTNSVTSWIKANIELSSGHGNIHGSGRGSGQVQDAPSSTRFHSLAGKIIADGSTTENNTEWLVRNYDTFAAMQVRVAANARLNDSIFRNRIDGGDGTGVITFATLVTGLIEDTAVGDAITTGQTINTSITLGTGVEDLSLTFIAATLKSSGNHSESWIADELGLARAASATAHYVPIGGWLGSFTAYTEAQAAIKLGFAGTASNLRCYLSANTYASDGTLKLMQNGAAVLTTTLTAGGGAAWYENASDTVSFDADDVFSLEFDEGGASGSISLQSAGITFQAAAGGGAIGYWGRSLRYIATKNR